MQQLSVMLKEYDDVNPWERPHRENQVFAIFAYH